MAELVKNLAGILYKLDDLYYETKNKEEKEKIKVFSDNLSKLLEESVRSQFDENDKLYKEVVVKLKKTEREIEKLKKDLEKSVIVFEYLSELIYELDTLIFNFKRS